MCEREREKREEREKIEKEREKMRREVTKSVRFGEERESGSIAIDTENK